MLTRAFASLSLALACSILYGQDSKPSDLAYLGEDSVAASPPFSCNRFGTLKIAGSAVGGTVSVVVLYTDQSGTEQQKSVTVVTTAKEATRSIVRKLAEKIKGLDIPGTDVTGCDDSEIFVTGLDSGSMSVASTDTGIATTPPVQNLSAEASKNPTQITLKWQLPKGTTFTRIRIFLDGTLISKQPPTAVSYSDRRNILRLVGKHKELTYTVVAENDSVVSHGTSITIKNPDQ